MPSSKTWAALLLSVALLLPKAAHGQTKPSLESSPRTQVAEQLVELGLQIHETTLDCSHFVNALFDAMGLDYDYQPSRILYRGTNVFKRIYRPATGDLIVWPGHVGIVVDPQEKTFVSALRTGVKVASYTSRYWRRRGHPRFLRYSLPITPTLAWQIKDGPEFEIVHRSGTE
jgi:cell wall-associated NlpC family hydrolase